MSRDVAGPRRSRGPGRAPVRLGENVAFFFDTFHDRRNGVEFGVSPSGGRYEGQVTNERSYNGDWNPVWNVAVGRFAGGWTVEAALPFTSLRYGPGRAQVWGFQARRISAWKNELSFLTRLPPELGMGRGIFAASLAPVIVDLEAPERSQNLELKPYRPQLAAMSERRATETRQPTDDTLWDAFFLYPPGGRWADPVPAPIRWGYPIMVTRDQLRRDVDSLVQK